MDVKEAIRKRYSCRAYKSDPVEGEKLKIILNSARLAPSARNFQDWRFVVVTDADLRLKLSLLAADQKFVSEAPVVIVACSISDYLMRCGHAIAPIDVSIALEHIALQAVELGMATCWVGAFYPDQIRPVLGIPENVQIIELMTLGYPADTQPGTKRRPLESIISYNKWDFQVNGD